MSSGASRTEEVTLGRSLPVVGAAATVGTHKLMDGGDNPPGLHIVELSYWPWSCTAGFAFSCALVAAVMVRSLVALVRRRQRPVNQEPTSASDIATRVASNTATPHYRREGHNAARRNAVRGVPVLGA